MLPQRPTIFIALSRACNHLEHAVAPLRLYRWSSEQKQHDFDRYLNFISDLFNSPSKASLVRHLTFRDSDEDLREPRAVNVPPGWVGNGNDFSDGGVEGGRKRVTRLTERLSQVSQQLADCITMLDCSVYLGNTDSLHLNLTDVLQASCILISQT